MQHFIRFSICCFVGYLCLVPQEGTGVGKQTGNNLPDHCRVLLGDLGFRHGGAPITSLAFFANDTVLATSGRDQVMLWDVAKAKARLPGISLAAPTRCLDSSPDGTTLALGTHEGAVLWNVETAQVVHRFEPKGHLAIRGVFSPDGSLLAAALLDGPLCVWEAKSGKLLFSFRPKSADGKAVVTRGLAISPDGQLLAATASDIKTRIWDIRSGKELHSFLVPSNFSDVRFWPDGKSVVVSTDHKGPFQRLDVQMGKQLPFSIKAEGGAYSFDISRDGELLAWVSTDFILRISETKTGLERHKLQLVDLNSPPVRFSRSGKHLAVGGSSVVVLDPSTGKEVVPIQGHRSEVRAVAFYKADRVVSVDRNTFRIWDVTSGKELRYDQFSKGRAVSALSPDGNTIAWSKDSGKDGLVDVLSGIATGRKPQACKPAAFFIETLAFSSNAEYLAAGGNRLQLTDLRTGEPRPIIDNNFRAIVSITFSPSRPHVAQANVDGSVTIWDFKTQKKIHEVNHSKDVVYAIMYSPDGEILASAGIDATTRLWSTKTGKEIRRHGDPQRAAVFSGPRSLCFSPDGHTLAIGDSDGSIVLWDISTGKELCTLQGHQHCVNCLAFSSDGKLLASGSSDTTVRIWDVLSAVAGQKK